MILKTESLRNRSVIAIGNGPSATSWEAGDLIDSFDIVIRFNNYEIDGYEKYVGTKTTHWVFNANKLVTWHRDYSQFEKVLVNCPSRVLRSRTEWKADLKVMYPNIEFLQRPTIKKFQQVVDLGRGKAFSAGLSGICYFLLRSRKLHIHGFDCFKKYADGILSLQKRSRHYFGHKSIPYKGHSPKHEQAFIDDMKKKNKIEELQEIVSV